MQSMVLFGGTNSNGRDHHFAVPSGFRGRGVHFDSSAGVDVFASIAIEQQERAFMS
jgi:hypothetical protein